MNQNEGRSRSRQLEIRFDGDEVWDRLPPPVGRQCQGLLTQLLVAAVRQETASSQGGDGHERQD